jgi:hypothetical protein
MNNPYQPPSSSLAGSDSYAGTTDTISPRIAEIMARTRGWVRFAGIMFFVFAALAILGAFMEPGSPHPGGVSAEGAGRIAGSFIGVLFYIYPGIKLNAYASGITRMLASGHARDLQAALNEHRGFWKYCGVLSVILLVVVVAGLLLALMTAASRMGR